MLERGSLRGRFVSAPMMKCEADRWFRAERTWGALKAGFNGTWIEKVSFWRSKRHGRTHTRTAPSLNNAYVTLIIC
jgi:hypothetical protein